MVKIKRLKPNATLPAYQHPGDAGADLSACVDGTVVINSGEFKLINTGIALELEEGQEAQIRPRSGLAVKYGVTVLNAPGTIDCGFKGELGVILINHGNHKFEINNGDRIAQLVFANVIRPQMIEAALLKETERNTNGFGSTGIGT